MIISISELLNGATVSTINPAQLIASAASATSTPKLAPAPKVESVDNGPVEETESQVLELILTEKQEKARTQALKMTANTWHTDMIVDRLVNPDYDLRMMTGDFSDIELRFTGIEQCGVYTVYSFDHFDMVKPKNGNVSTLKRLAYIYVLSVEKYDTGQKHVNGDPVKGVRYQARQYSKVDLTALRLSSNRDSIIKELQKIQRKEKADKALSDVEKGIKAHFARLGVTVADLLEAREGDTAGFGNANWSTGKNDAVKGSVYAEPEPEQPTVTVNLVNDTAQKAVSQAVENAGATVDKPKAPKSRAKKAAPKKAAAKA